MKKFKLVCGLLACIMSVLTFGACQGGGDKTSSNSSSSSSKPPKETIEPLPTDKIYSVLFIGNSYTKRYSMGTDIFLPLAQSAGYAIESKAIVNGGHTLEQFADPNDSFGALVAKELEVKDKYDFVVLQEQSLRPITETGKFYDGVRDLSAKIKEAGATPVLFSTWARKTGSSDLASLNMTNESMTWHLAATYNAIAEELNIPIAFVGLAFHDVYTNNPSIEIYDDDLYHPIYPGSYLAAATIFAKIFNSDPRELDYNGNGFFGKETAKVLKTAAMNAVFHTPEIPAEYIRSSVGISGNNSDAAPQQTRNLDKLPSSELISVLKGSTYPNGKSFSGILGTKGKIASTEYSTTGLTAEQKADIADIGYGISMIGVEKMDANSKGYTTAIENLVNGHWGTTLMCTVTFDSYKYDINGNVADDGKYRALITLNFGKNCRFDAIGFASGSLNGFPGAADVYVSNDGKNWSVVRTACWDKVNGKSIISCTDATSLVDPWKANTTDIICLFDMAEVEGQYIRLGVIIGRSDKTTMYNTINTRELLVFGE